MSAQVSELNPGLTKRISTANSDVGGEAVRPTKISVRQLNFFYGTQQALYDVSLDIQERVVTAFIGPSGCGKSTFIRTLNRMNDVIPVTSVTGQILIRSEERRVGKECRYQKAQEK